jgi:hypothetical protein
LTQLRRAVALATSVGMNCLVVDGAACDRYGYSFKRTLLRKLAAFPGCSRFTVTCS